MIYHVTDWDDAYANGAHIPQADGFVPRWQNAAAAFRQAHPPQPLGRALRLRWKQAQPASEFFFQPLRLTLHPEA